MGGLDLCVSSWSRGTTSSQGYNPHGAGRFSHSSACEAYSFASTCGGCTFVRRETTAGEDFSAMGALCRRIAALFYVIIKAADLDPLRATMFSVLASYLHQLVLEVCIELCNSGEDTFRREITLLMGLDV